MKKSLLTIICSLVVFNAFAFETKWNITNETEVYKISWDGINFVKTSEVLHKNTTVIGKDSNLYINNGITMVNIDEYETYFVDIKTVEPLNTEITFDDFFLKDELDKKKFFIISESYFKSLSKNDRNILTSIEKEGYKDYQRNKGELDYEWFESRTEYNSSYIYNVVISLRNVFSYYDFMIQKIEKNNNTYTITGEVTYWNDKDSTYTIPKKNEIIVTELIVDGDYLRFYLQNKLIGTYVITDKQTSDQINELIRKNTCDLSKVTWPRHADGTCDYDGSSKNVTTANTSQIKSITLSTNVSVNKTMVAKENLKLRSAEATSSQVLTVMSAGTKVKILELGKTETIDGINSNWVKVEIISGKDRDGKILKSGTTGWCYGGYLQ